MSGGMNGGMSGGMGGDTGGGLVSPDAITTSRAAVAGPFQGETLGPATPGFNQPGNLARWDDAPRVTACFTELAEGLAFDTHPAGREASLTFADLHARPPRRKTLVTLRAPGRALLRQQLDLVAAYADLRGDRAAEVVAQMTFPIGFWSALIGISPHRHKTTLQLIELVFSLAVHVEMRFKHIFAILRPVALSPQIHPMVPTPGHASWPSGHATEAFATATLLESLLDAARPATQDGQAARQQLQRLAARIAVNRTVAGLHYPVDSAGGRLLGTALGEFLVARARGGSVRLRGFDSTQFTDPGGAPKDFRLGDPLDAGACRKEGPPIALPQADTVGWLWQEALKEWS